MTSHQRHRSGSAGHQGPCPGNALPPLAHALEVTGAGVFLKFENHQFTASFKERGALNKLLSLTAAESAKGVIACSAGNHAQGVAYHAHRLGIPAVIVMPRYTPYVKVEHTQKHGAEVILEGENFDGAKTFAIEACKQRHLTLVHPYDDERIIAGQGTCAWRCSPSIPRSTPRGRDRRRRPHLGASRSPAKAIRPDIDVVGVRWCDSPRCTTR
jgi:threonine dehydratase